MEADHSPKPMLYFNGTATELSSLKDEELMRLIQDCNDSAFATLVERHTVKFYSLAYRMLANKDDAEDVVQDAFLKLWYEPAKWQPNKGAKFTTWFYRVVVNLCLDFTRKKKYISMMQEYDIAADDRDLDELLDRQARQQFLESIILELPERQRIALNLCFYEGLSNKEAAIIMKVNLKALESLLMRAKSNLKSMVRKTKVKELSR